MVVAQLNYRNVPILMIPPTSIVKMIGGAALYCLYSCGRRLFA